MILKGMSLIEFKGDPSIPTKPARKRKYNSGGANFLYYTAFGQLLDYPLLKFDCLASVQKNLISKS